MVHPRYPKGGVTLEKGESRFRKVWTGQSNYYNKKLMLQLHCTMFPLSTSNCFKSSKVRPISNCWFCRLIYKKICLNVLESKQRREKLVFVIL